MKKSRLLGALCAVVFSFITMSANAAVIPSQGTWKTTLEARDLDGVLNTAEAYYDKVLDVTWLGDANYAQTSGYVAGGQMIWDTATNWASGLDFGSGIDNWRLPTMLDTDAPGCDLSTIHTGTDCGANVQTTSNSPPYPADTVYSEMASMYYDTLGNLSYLDTSGTGPQTGWGLTNTGPFDNLQSSIYWSGLEYALITNSAWEFNFYNGGQGSADKGHTGSTDNVKYAWAVHDGDVGTAVIPSPLALWLWSAWSNRNDQEEGP